MPWSACEIDELKRLYKKHANDPVVISNIMGKTPNAVRTKVFRLGLHREEGGAPVQQPTPVETPAKPEPPPVDVQVKHDRQLTALRSENQLLRQKYRLLTQETNAQDRIVEYARLALEALPAVPPPPPPAPFSTETTESAVLLCSCWHIGETINKQQMGGLNEYNFEIFCRRLQVLVERVIGFTTENMRAHRFEELHIFHTGDAVSGIIHDELEQTNELTIVEQAMLGALVTAQALQDLARAFPRVIFTGVVGNHGRGQHQKYFKHKAPVNWDFVFYNNLAMLLRNQTNIQFNIPLSYWAGVEVRGWKFLVQHGDGIKSWAGIPFYGIQREVQKWREVKAAQNDHFQYFVASHFHTRAALQTSVGENILNASLKGGDEYAIGLSLFNRPSQLLFGVHERHGKTWELSIDPSRGQDETWLRYRYDRTRPLAEQLL